MPPAFVLSQDQTLKFDLDHLDTTKVANRNSPNFKEPSCTKVNYLYMDMRKGHMCKSANLVTRTTRALKPLDPGPPPTCPFIYSSQCQRARAAQHKIEHSETPIFLPEDECSIILATKLAETLVFAASVRGRIWVTFDSVNRLFAILLQKKDRMLFGEALVSFCLYRAPLWKRPVQPTRQMQGILEAA